MDTTIQVEADRRLVRVSDWTLTVPNGSDEPLIEDDELAKRLGFKQARDVRKLIKRLIADGEIADVCERATVARSQTPTGGAVERAVTAYMLTEEQSLVVVMHSKTAKARETRKVMIRVFRAAMHGLLVPPNVLLLQGKLHQLEAENENLRFLGGGVIGEQRAEMHVLGPMRKTARALAFVDMDQKSYARHITRLDHQVRLHVDFPKSKGQGWHLLPTDRLARAQSKLAEMLAYAEERAELVSKTIERASENDMFKFFAQAQATRLHLAGDEDAAE